MNVTQAQIQGPRNYQEDRMVVNQNDDGSVLLAIFDGHGSWECVEKAASSVASFYKVADVSSSTNEELVLYIFKALNELTRHYDSGSTASIVLIDKDFSVATVGILGDSPVWIAGPDKEFLSPEHNVRTNETEAQAVRDRGGFIANGYAFQNRFANGLQMSRALGDASLDKILSREPEIFTVPIDKYSTVLLASDGLFDPSHEEKGLPQDIRQLLAYDDCNALQIVNTRHYTAKDNVSAILAKAQ